MSNSLRTKLRSFSIAHLLRNIRLFSSIDNDVGHFNHPPEPIPNRPMRKQSNPSRNFQPPHINRVRENDNLSLSRGKSRETDVDFLERFKLGFDNKPESPKTDNTDKTIQVEKAASTTSPSASVDADEIFKKMKETGLIPNAVAMLDGLCKDGLVQEAMKLFGLMREKGTIPDVVIYTAVVDGYCKAHKFDDAIRIFKKMQNNGVAPNAFSYQVLIRGLYGGKQLEDAYGFTMEALGAGHSLNLETFTGLVDAYCRMKGVEEAQKVIRAMKEKGFFVEEKAAKEYLEKKGPFVPLVWEAILGKKASKMPLF